MVPFNDLRRRFAHSRDDIRRRFDALLDGGIFIGGPLIDEFQHEFAKYCGTKFCVAMANGTDALELALRGLGVGAGDEVVTVANAGGYATTACQAIGAVPVYVDVDPAICQMDQNHIAGAVGDRTRAIVVTHLYGMMNDVNAVRSGLEALGRSNIAILEDCAQSHGSSREGAPCGSLGDAAAFSFYPTKNLGAVGDAGAVLCRSPEVEQRLKQLRQYGWSSKYRTVIPDGRNSRMDPLQAGVLLHQLPKLDGENDRRREICDIYRRNLPSGWRMVFSQDRSFVAHLAVVIAPSPEHRQRAMGVLQARDIGCDIHYPTLDCDQAGWAGVGRAPGGLEQSRRLTKKILSLPCFAEMTADEIDQVVDAFRAFV